MRWLAGNGADTAIAERMTVNAKAVCALTPHPSPTALQDAGAALNEPLELAELGETSKNLLVKPVPGSLWCKG